MPTRLHVSRRLIAAVAAALLALFGALVLISWVNGADARAQAGQQLVPVLVATSKVSTGTSADAMGGSVVVQQVPKRLVAPGSLTALSAVKGQVANADLLPGEQLVSGRFADPAKLLPAGTVAVPAGMVEVSVTLDAQRAVGGAVKAGDEVGVQITDQKSADSGVSSYSVWHVFPDVLVTRATGPAADAKADANAQYTVTLALPPADAAAVILGTTSKSIWLSMVKPAVGSAVSTTSSSTTATFTTGGSK